MKDIDGYNGVYKITEDGRVFHCYKHLPPREVSYAENNDGYIQVRLWDRNLRKMKYWKVHRLVALTFIPNPENKPEVNHKDGNKKRNDVSNLEWCNHSENILHAYRTGLLKSGNARPIKSKDSNGNIEYHNSIAECSRKLGICASNISDSLSGTRGSIKVYTFEYIEGGN